MGWLSSIAGVVGSVAGGIQSASAAHNAASAEAQYANQALEAEQGDQENALSNQENEWGATQKNLAPWLQEGNTALSNLSALTNTPGEGLLQAYPGGPFTSPTAEQAAAQPGYQFGLNQGEEALQNSAAASGSLESGNTQEALNNYAQQYAQTDYNNVYNQALQNYNTNFGVWNTDQTNTFNRLNSLSTLGQQTGTSLGTLGQLSANNTGTLDLQGGLQQAGQLDLEGSAYAGGDINAANAWNSMISGILASAPGASGSPYQGFGSTSGGGGGGGGGGGMSLPMMSMMSQMMSSGGSTGGGDD
jgi:hypothetical protein